MLHKISKFEYEKHIDYVYNISSDLSHSAFPIYADGIKTKDLFCSRSKKGLTDDSEEILLYEREGKVKGWIHYYFIESDKYLGLCSMLIENGFGEALEELFQYWRKRFSGYSWCFYLPSENKEALEFMAKNGISDNSREIVDVLLFKDYTSVEEDKEDKNIIPINGDNFEIFGNIHCRYDDEMYWTGDRIKKDLDRWRIFAYVEEEKCLGALYYVCAGKDLEIFGIDYAEEKYDADVTKKLLISGLNKAGNEGAESMYFFNDKDTCVIAEGLGFKRIAEALCFEGEL